MVLCGLVSTSVKGTLGFDSNHKKRVQPREWECGVILKSCSEHDFLVDDLNLSLPVDSCANSESPFTCKRKKLCKDFTSGLSSEPKIEKKILSTLESRPLDTTTSRNIDCVQAHVLSVGKCMKEVGDWHNVSYPKLDSTEVNKEHEDCLYYEMKAEEGDQEIKQLCIAILRSNKGDWPSNSDGVLSSLLLETGTENSTLQTCKVCGNVGSAINMYLCDCCEAAFHVACSNPKGKIVTDDEWFCKTCSRYARKRPYKIKTSNGAANSRLGPITRMLRYPEQHISNVRIGASFQVDVPAWSDQAMKKCLEDIEEPGDLDTTETSELQTSSTKKFSKPDSARNWLQCKAVICDDSKDGVKRICGKWRRAPLFKVQTDNWECFDSVLWDPRYSDCAVPQEVATEEVLRQLKYIKQLKSRLNAKRKN